MSDPAPGVAPSSPGRPMSRAELDPIWDVERKQKTEPVAKARILLLAAMPEEALPVLHGRQAERIESPAGESWRIEIDSPQGRGAEVILITCGIGLVNAAMAATLGIERHRPELIISLGSAGGLAGQVRRGDIVVGTTYRYGDADSTAFGYQYGQVPGMPSHFEGDARLVDSVRNDEFRTGTVHYGEILSANSFITGELATILQQRFPTALAADMESTAIAQVAASNDIGFICVRSISDLCGEHAAQEWDDAIGTVAARSAQAVWNLIERLAEQ